MNTPRCALIGCLKIVRHFDWLETLVNEIFVPRSRVIWKNRVKGIGKNFRGVLFIKFYKMANDELRMKRNLNTILNENERS